MKKYAVIEYVNDAFLISSEHGENLDGARIGFWSLCTSLTNATEAVNATVKLVDEKFDTVEGKIEFIQHDAKE